MVLLSEYLQFDFPDNPIDMEVLFKLLAPYIPGFLIAILLISILEVVINKLLAKSRMKQDIKRAMYEKQIDYLAELELKKKLDALERSSAPSSGTKRPISKK